MMRTVITVRDGVPQGTFIDDTCETSAEYGRKKMYVCTAHGSARTIHQWTACRCASGHH